MRTIAASLPLGFWLPRASHERLVAGEGVYLTNVDRETVRISRFVDFLDYIAEPSTAPMGPPMVDAVPATIRGYGDSPLVLADGLDAPTSLAIDPMTRDLLVTELRRNRITRVQIP